MPYSLQLQSSCLPPPFIPTLLGRAVHVQWLQFLTNIPVFHTHSSMETLQHSSEIPSFLLVFKSNGYFGCLSFQISLLSTLLIMSFPPLDVSDTALVWFALILLSFSHELFCLHLLLQRWGSWGALWPCSSHSAYSPWIVSIPLSLNLLPFWWLLNLPLTPCVRDLCLVQLTLNWSCHLSQTSFCPVHTSPAVASPSPLSPKLKVWKSSLILPHPYPLGTIPSLET